MKAIVLRELGGPDKLQYEETEKPQAGPRDVVVRLKTAALNRRDVFITYGQYPNVKLPAIPGSDGAGVVAEVGPDVDADWDGREVIVNPGLYWGNNPRVNARTFSILGVPKNGTYAQYVRVPAENVYEKPPHLTWEEAAALPLAGLTAYRALVTRGEVKSGEVVLIPGAGGGVATFLVQFAAAHGAKVYVTSSKDEKISQAIALGASGGVNYRSEHWVKDLKAMTGGVDLVVDSIGGETFSALVSLTKPGGRIVSFGATRGPVPEFVLPRLFLKQLDLRGSTMGSPDEFSQMVDFVNQHNIRPVIDDKFALEEATAAQKKMERGENFGKIVLEIPE